ncbi:hypothetical protein [Prochlorococcus sp. MIT 1223]|uniref:hypothetical protein n=1 Tax=Prochlorococcus sp. MIT 1223 TaxID=3096217 RepID=UPI002A75F2DE|nr:hypothetical protein [Prochlorococcus sp. MIT 1223]
MSKFSAKNLNNFFLKPFILLISCFLISSCQKNRPPAGDELTVETYPYLESELNQIKVQLSQLEEHVQIKKNINDIQKIKSLSKSIKSITFRFDSKDDRIRIYWSDGSKTDLPCTKEQSIWACG